MLPFLISLLTKICNWFEMFLANLNQIRASGDADHVKAYLKTKKIYLKKEMRRIYFCRHNCVVTIKHFENFYSKIFEN